MDITATQFKVLCSIRCEVCITPVELKTVLSVDLGALTRMLDRLVCKGWIERLPNPTDKRGVLVQLTPDALCEQCHQVVGQKLHQELTKICRRMKWPLLSFAQKSSAVIRRGKMMSRRNN
jgi:MarR family multiple antibiotic resistance transcriptional regulator